MKRLFIILLCALVFFAALISCTKKQEAELTVFAAASLTEALTEIAKLYKTQAQYINLVFNFDSSGKLQTQIENGAEADIFLSAAQRQMDSLETGGYIDTATRTDLLVNKVVLIVPDNAASGSINAITSFEDCLTSKVSLIALGNADVPVGQYSQEIFEYLNGWEIVSRKASFGSNVKEVLSHVETASVDCGVVYSTDVATSRGVRVVAYAPEGSHNQVLYPAAVLRASKNEKLAKDFLDFLSSDEASAIFQRIGFEVAK